MSPSPPRPRSRSSSATSRRTASIRNLDAMMREIELAGAARSFHLYILSDTGVSEIAALEETGQHAATGQHGVHLRHHRPGDGGRLGPGHRVLRRHHRDERDVRDAHPLQLGHQHRRADAGDQLVVRRRRQDLDLPPPARRELPHRPADDRAGGQGLDPAHDQAERRRLLRLGRGQDDRHARPVHAGLPPEATPSPLALEASADYSAYIYDTQGPAGAVGQRVHQLAERRARRGHRPVHRPDLEQGPGVRGLPEAVRQVLGRLVRLALHQGGVPRGAAGHHGRAAAALRAGHLHRADRPVAVVLVQGRLRHHHGQLAVLAEPARRSSTSRRSACRSARRSCTRSTTTASSRRCAARACSPAASSRPGCSGTSATCRTTPTTRPRRRRCSTRPATGPGRRH